MTTIISVLIGTCLVQAIIVAVAAILSPGMSRPDLFFSVTVEPSFRNSVAGRGILRRFNRFASLYSLIGVMITIAAVFTRENLVLSCLLLFAACFVQWAGITKSYAIARRRALVHQVAPSPEREAALEPREHLSIKFWLAQLGPFLVLGLVSIWLWGHWDQIPARYPIHWGLDGRPNGWGGRTVGNVFLSPITGAITCLFLAVIMQALARGVRRVHSSGSEAQKEARNLKNMLRVILGVEYWFALMFGALAFLPFFAKSNGSPFSPAIIGIFSGLMSVVIVSAVFVIAVKSGQGGWRLGNDKGSKEAGNKSSPAGDRTPDVCWKGGIIYYNPHDPAVWVEKRFGYGWTLNMAAPRAWVIMGAILLFGLGLPLLSVFLLKK